MLLDAIVTTSFVFWGQSMQQVDLTWPRVVSVWWLIVWRGAVGALVLGAAAGFVIGIVGFFLGISEQVPIISGLAGALISIAWWIIVIRMALKKEYKDFDIVLVRPRADTL
jgi:hypothetical protein